MPAPEPTKSQILMAELMAQNELASLVRDAVLKSGLDRQEVAQRLGVHKSNISRVLNNPRNMTVRLAARILRVVGQRIVYASVPATATNYRFCIVDASPAEPQTAQQIEAQFKETFELPQ